MNDSVGQWLSLIGVILFVGSAIWYVSKTNEKRKLIVQREFEKNVAMFKVFFNHSNAIAKELKTPLLSLKRSKSGKFILPVSLCFIFIIISFFYRGNFTGKLIVLIIIVLWFVWSILNATVFAVLYDNAIVHGNILKKSCIWLNEIDSIEARLYDYNGVTDESQAHVYRVYEVKKSGKVIFDIWEIQFSDARMIEECFTSENLLVTEIQESSI